MNKINGQQNNSNTIDNKMPVPLEFLNEVFSGQYNEKIDQAYMKLLQSNIIKKLKPFVDMALADENYVGSPIYNGYVDRDTINTVVDKAIYYAQKQYPELSQIFSNIDTSEYSKTTLLRAIMHEMVLNKVYYELRPENKDNINYNNNDIVIPVTDESMPMDETVPLNYDNMSLLKNVDIMPLPLGA